MNHDTICFDDLEVGWTRSFTRVITAEAMQATIALTGDQGGYHVDERFAQAAGFRTLITPGMLQASMVTQLGGSINFLAREMRFQFLKPVYVGDTLRATGTVTALEPERQLVRMLGTVTNQEGVEVLTVEIAGHVPRREWGAPVKPPPVEHF